MMHSSVLHASAGRQNVQRMFLPLLSHLKARWTGRLSGEIGTTLSASGPSPPVVTVSGTLQPAITLPLDVQIYDIQAGTARGQAKFRWSVDGGHNWSTDTTGASVALGSTGLTLAFAVGTYGVEQRWTATYDLLTNLVPAVSANMVQATANNQPAFTPYGCQGYNRLVFNGSTQFLQCATGINALISGTDLPFTLVIVGHIQSISSAAAGSQPIAGWARSVTSANPFWLWGVRGPAGTPANAWTSIREDNVPAIITVNDATTPPDLNPHVWVIHSSGTNVRITQDGVQILNGSQNVGAMTVDRFFMGGIVRFGLAFAGLNIGVIEWALYDNDVGNDGAARIASCYKNRYCLNTDSQVREVICLVCYGASNSNGVTAGGAGTPSDSMAPPPGNFWTNIPYLRRILAPNGDAISDSALTRLKFNTVASGNYHGVSLQMAIDMAFAGHRVAVLQMSADGSGVEDWISAGTYAAAGQTALSDFDALIATKFPNATRKYCMHVEDYLYSKDATNTRANNYPTNFATFLSNCETTLGKNIHPRVSITLTPTILTVAPSSAPAFAAMRTAQTTTAANAGGLTFDPDPYSNLTGYVQSDNTHYFGRCANFVGGGNALNLLSLL